MCSQLTADPGKRHFSDQLLRANRAFLVQADNIEKTYKIGFVLPEYFSMVAFTTAVDAIKTANLIYSQNLFSLSIFGLNTSQIQSDLGIQITAEQPLTEVGLECDVILVCGGFRCDVSENKLLSEKLRFAANRGAIICGISNGAIALAHADLLDDSECAVHPENHAFMRENFAGIRLSEDALVTDASVYSSAGTASTLDMMLRLIGVLQGKDIMQAVRRIIIYEKAEGGINSRTDAMESPLLPEKLLNILQLMVNNLEDPLSIDELVEFSCVCRRQIERLFQHYLNTSPSRYYLELRVTHARRLLLQSNASMIDISLASGFSTSSHFSTCFKSFFGEAPSKVRKKYFKGA
ncbi:MAG: GlxA family transcriptional regulator [Amphritea sp.]